MALLSYLRKRMMMVKPHSVISDPRVRSEEAVQFILNYWKEGRSLKNIAALFNVDPGNLDRQFRRQTGVTVKIYLDEKRKDYVISQIRRNSKFGYEIGHELGFSDDLAFYRWVRRVFGLSLKGLRNVVCAGEWAKERRKKVSRSKISR
jgi:AraC-like DNA-binding protein